MDFSLTKTIQRFWGYHDHEDPRIIRGPNSQAEGPGPGDFATFFMAKSWRNPRILYPFPGEPPRGRYCAMASDLVVGEREKAASCWANLRHFCGGVAGINFSALEKKTECVLLTPQVSLNCI